MRVGPLGGLFTSRSTGPMTWTVTSSIIFPAPSVMYSSAVVVLLPVGRGRGAWVAGAAGVVVGGGVAGGCGLGAAGGVVCNKVSNKRATMSRCYYGGGSGVPSAELRASLRATASPA